MENKFPIFKPKNSVFVFTKGHLLFIILIGLIITQATFYPKNGFFKLFSILFFIYCSFFVFTNSFRYKKLDGEFDGELIFNDNHILVNDKKIKTDDVAKIHIRATDYDGYLRGGTHSLKYNKSNGTNNLLDIVTNDNQKIKVFFQMNFMQQEEILPFVRSLIMQYNIPFEYGAEIESVNEYYRFKRIS
jgi:energy-coupling factor transporter transmembrane protein EcfT